MLMSKKLLKMAIKIVSFPTQLVVVNGGSDTRSEFGVFIFLKKIVPIQWRADSSYLEFPKHLLVFEILSRGPVKVPGGSLDDYIIIFGIYVVNPNESPSKSHPICESWCWNIERQIYPSQMSQKCR